MATREDVDDDGDGLFQQTDTIQMEELEQHSSTERCVEPPILAVAAIDFGTTYSGIAFSLVQEYDRYPLKIDCPIWQSKIGGSCISSKTPTTALINPDKTFQSFGYDAEEEYAEMADDNAHYGWIYYRNFKMLLHNSHDITRGTELKDPAGNTLSAMKVFADCIEFLKGELLNLLKRRGDLVKEKDIKWVLTVPAIWRDQAKQFMREAALMAGIENKRLVLALEPEAASIYAKESLSQRISCKKTGQATLAPYDIGTKYLVVDLGGGTIDMTMREVLGDRSLRELHKATGGDWGGLTVNNAFFDFIRALVGEDVLKELKEDYKFDFLDLEREIETKKRGIRKDCKSNRVLIKLPGHLSDIYRKHNKKSLTNAVIFESEYAGKVDLKHGALRIDKSIAIGFFDQATEKTIQHIKQLSSLPVAEGLADIILVGGFAESFIIQDAIKEAFSDKIRVVVPEDTGLSVLKGAVLYGQNPNIVTERVAQFTYGTRVYEYFVQDYHDEQKRDMIGGVPYCKDIFSKLAEVDRTYRIGEIVWSDDELYPVRSNLREMTLHIYTSTQPNPKYVTDEGCDPLGKITVKIDEKNQKNQKVQVGLIFGDTEIGCIGKDMTTGTRVDTWFDTL